MTRLGGHGLDHVFHTVRTDFLEVVRTWTDSRGADDVGAAALLELTDPTGERAGSVLTAVGEPRRVADLLATVTPAAPVRAASVTRGTGALAGQTLSGWGLGPSSTWDRMVTETAPTGGPVPDAVVVELDLDRDADEADAVLAEANPGTLHGVRHRHAARARWYGVRVTTGPDSEALVAVGSATPVPGDAVHLGAIGTRPAYRGRGYGGALTARMTADGVARCGLVTLGMYADNDGARRLYERLGFVVVHRVESWRPA
ncbi:MAG TPA: N-acetyltransferase [Promicromonospora sp.]|nr:N-acetyltransferase [Promicromonospora sp.]